jgi:5-methyltetrahydrofolate--homocysteine methyltransferase
MGKDWGFPNPPGMKTAQRFTSPYRGKKHSFAYPACTNLDEQGGIWKLLKPDELGVQLTEGFMMDRKPASAGWSFIIRVVRISPWAKPRRMRQV